MFQGTAGAFRGSQELLRDVPGGFRGIRIVLTRVRWEILSIIPPIILFTINLIIYTNFSRFFFIFSINFDVFFDNYLKIPLVNLIGIKSQFIWKLICNFFLRIVSTISLDFFLEISSFIWRI